MTVPTATIALLLLLFIKSSYCYVPSLRVSFTLSDSKRTILLPSVLDHSQQRSQQCCGLILGATNDPVAPLPLASASEMERKLMELERKLEKAEMERKLSEMDRKLEKAEAERKLVEMEAERKLEKAEAEAERKLEKAEMDRKLEKAEAERKLVEMEAERKLAEAERKLEKAEMQRKLEKAEAERKQGKKSIISSSFIDFTLILSLSFLSIEIAC